MFYYGDKEKKKKIHISCQGKDPVCLGILINHSSFYQMCNICNCFHHFFRECGWELNSRSLIQPSDTLPVELNETYIVFTIYSLKIVQDKSYRKKN